MYEPKMGTYTELWSGLGSKEKTGDGGKLAIPWGKVAFLSTKAYSGKHEDEAGGRHKGCS